MKRALSPLVVAVFLLTACAESDPADPGGTADAAPDVSVEDADAGGGDAAEPDVEPTEDADEPDVAPDTDEDVEVCEPDCEGKVCGDDGCGGSCGFCPSCPGEEPLACNADGTCPTPCCPQCTGKACGDDGCGGACGTCEGEAVCQAGSCVTCQPDCEGKACGDDGCGGSCGACGDGESCAAGACVSDCTPDCTDKACGDDGCGGSCGTCGGQEVCQAGACECVPACNGLECGDDGCGGDCGPCAGSDICSAGTCLPPATDPVYSTFIGDWDMGPGNEVTKCVVKKLSNTAPIIVNKIHTVLANGSHHMIIYKTNDTQEKTEPFNCTPFTDTLLGGGAPLMITEVAEETLEFPPGVGIQLEANQMVRIEAHFLNYYPETITAHGDVEFFTADGSEISDLADFMFYGATQFNVPGDGQPYDTGWRWLPTHDDVNVFAITGHTHQWGTNVEIERSTDAGTTGLHMYPGDAPFLWSEAPVEKFDPPVTFGPQDGFRFKCTWVNTSGKNVGFGESANKEMCFLWAYYYPSKGYTLCADGLFTFLCP